MQPTASTYWGEGKQENDAGVGAGALRLYCAGTVFAGISILMAGYFQVCGRERSDRDRPRSPAPFRRVWRRIRPALFHVGQGAAAFPHGTWP